MSEEDYVDKQCIKENLARGTPTRLVNLKEPLETARFQEYQKIDLSKVGAARLRPSSGHSLARLRRLRRVFFYGTNCRLFALRQLIVVLSDTEQATCHGSVEFLSRLPGN